MVPFRKKLAVFGLASVLLLLVFNSSSWARNDFKRLGKAGFTFLKISPSARAAGMGDAYTAIANDVYAIFYNPAGLTHVQRFEYGFGLTNWIVGSKLMSAAFAHPLGRGVLGVSFISFAPPEFEETTIIQPEGTGRMVHVGDLSVGLAYGVRLTDRLSFGFKTQFVEETIDKDKARGALVDFSTYYYTGFRDLVIAMAMKNFGPDVKYLSEKFKLPLYFNINTSISAIGHEGAPLQLTLSAESAFATDYRDRYHVGAELWLLDKLALRGGYKFYYDTEDYTLGLGFRLRFGERRLTVDIAYSNFASYFDAPLRFSIGGAF